MQGLLGGGYLPCALRLRNGGHALVVFLRRVGAFLAEEFSGSTTTLRKLGDGVISAERLLAALACGDGGMPAGLLA
jgi:hypothetical protein